MDTQICTRCNEEKPITEYYRDIASPKGYTARCKTCLREAERKRRATRKAKFLTLPRPTQKQCNRCGEVLPITMFYADACKPDGYMNMCKICKEQYGQIWKELNSDRKLEKPDELKRCVRCEQFKPRSQFPPRPDRPGMLYNKCNTCRNLRSHRKEVVAFVNKFFFEPFAAPEDPDL